MDHGRAWRLHRGKRKHGPGCFECFQKHTGEGWASRSGTTNILCRFIKASRPCNGASLGELAKPADLFEATWLKMGRADVNGTRGRPTNAPRGHGTARRRISTKQVSFLSRPQRAVKKSWLASSAIGTEESWSIFGDQANKNDRVIG